MTTTQTEPAFSYWHFIFPVSVAIGLALLAYYCWRIIRAATISHTDFTKLQGEQNLTDVEKRQAYQMGLFAEYHKQGLLQSKVTFICSLVFAGIGFVVIVWSLAYLISKDAPQTTLLNQQIAKAEKSRDQAKDSIREIQEKQTEADARQKAEFAEVNRKRNVLTSQDKDLRADYSRLASETTDQTEPLPQESFGLFGFSMADNNYSFRNSSKKDVQGILQSLRSSVHLSFLRTYIASSSAFTNTISLENDILTLLRGLPLQSNSMQNVLLEFHNASRTGYSPESDTKLLRQFLELVIRVQLGEEQMEQAFKDLSSANGSPELAATTSNSGGYMPQYPFDSFEQYTTLAIQLRELDDDLSRFRRLLETFERVMLSSENMEIQIQSDASNAVQRAVILTKIRQIYAQSITNEPSNYYPPYAYGQSPTNNALEDAKADLNRQEQAIKDLNSQIAKISETKGADSKSMLNQPLGILGVIAGTIIDAVAALFFVQSNRAKELMAQFFDRLRSDRKLDEAIRLANLVPNADAKSALLRDLSLLLAACEKPTPTDDKTAKVKTEKKPKEDDGST